MLNTIEERMRYTPQSAKDIINEMAKNDIAISSQPELTEQLEARNLMLYSSLSLIHTMTKNELDEKQNELDALNEDMEFMTNKPHAYADELATDIYTLERQAFAIGLNL